MQLHRQSLFIGPYENTITFTGVVPSGYAQTQFHWRFEKRMPLYRSTSLRFWVVQRQDFPRFHCTSYWPVMPPEDSLNDRLKCHGESYNFQFKTALPAATQIGPYLRIVIKIRSSASMTVARYNSKLERASDAMLLPSPGASASRAWCQ